VLGLPHSTEVNRRIAKEKLYANVALTSQTRDMIREQVEAVVWRNKLSDSTIGVSAGETVKEIQVFEVELRQRGLDKRVPSAIARAIPYKILFVLTYQDEAQAWMEASNTFYHTEWFALSGFTLKFEGLNLDAVYETLVRQISGGRLDSVGGIADAVARDKQRQKLERDIAALEKKVLREKQFNKQVELNGELRRLQAELEGLG
jgi:hypothetical protein